eukprot:5323668-Amphidinium_carterae.1
MFDRPVIKNGGMEMGFAYLAPCFCVKNNGPKVPCVADLCAWPSLSRSRKSRRLLPIPSRPPLEG